MVHISKNHVNIIFREKQWRHQGGAWGQMPPQSEALPPNQKKKMAKISHFWQIFGFLPPSESHFAPSMPPTKKKFLVPPLGKRSAHLFALLTSILAKINFWNKFLFCFKTSDGNISIYVMIKMEYIFTVYIVHVRSSESEHFIGMFLNKENNRAI